MSDDDWENEAEEQPQWQQSVRKPAAAAADDEDDWENEVDLVEQDLNKVNVNVQWVERVQEDCVRVVC
jgi:hypothetical protein